MACFPKENRTRNVRDSHEYRYVTPLWYILLNDLLLSGGMLKDHLRWNEEATLI